ncbi:unnamed protein product [Cylicostephanus goldi]|uniref:Uncharacterized protein n=1 Tax=Cylicostephanus goldi TaxID=71465 RepID=A0A3P6TPP1_CYLGO|nr:unnamed protein product [Cylicostephanus goldi]
MAHQIHTRTKKRQRKHALLYMSFGLKSVASWKQRGLEQLKMHLIHNRPSSKKVTGLLFRLRLTLLMVLAKKSQVPLPKGRETLVQQQERKALTYQQERIALAQRMKRKSLSGMTTLRNSTVLHMIPALKAKK